MASLIQIIFTPLRVVVHRFSLSVFLLFVLRFDSIQEWTRKLQRIECTCVQRGEHIFFEYIAEGVDCC